LCFDGFTLIYWNINTYPANDDYSRSAI